MGSAFVLRGASERSFVMFLTFCGRGAARAGGGLSFGVVGSKLCRGLWMSLWGRLLVEAGAVKYTIYKIIGGCFSDMILFDSS